MSGVLPKQCMLEQIRDIIQQLLHKKIFSLGLLGIMCQKYKNEEAIICGYGEIDVEWKHRMLP